MKPASSSSTRLVAWNVCGGGPRRVDRIASALASLQPSVVVLSEVTEGTLGEWQEALSGVGLIHQAVAPTAVFDAEIYRVLIATTTDHVRSPWTVEPPLPNRAVRVDVDGLSIIGVHAPFDKKTGGVGFYDWLTSEISLSLSTDAIVLGDFNADGIGTRLSMNAAFVRLTDAGWVHGLRHHQPDGDHLSYWGSSTGVAIDHCLLSPPLADRLDRAIIVAEVDGTPTAVPGASITAGALSDHRPLLVDLRRGAERSDAGEMAE